MKRLVLLLTLAALSIAFTAPAQAAKGDRKKGDGPRPAKILKQYDTNANGTIDGEEATALKKAFDGGSADLKGLDTDKDGKLSDTEISSIHARKKKN